MITWSRWKFYFTGQPKNEFFITPSLSVKVDFRYKLKFITVFFNFMFIRLHIGYSWSTLDMVKRNEHT